MFTNQDIIAIAFRLINFAALLSVGFILFKKHVMPDLFLSIARKKEMQDSLFLQQTHLEKQQLNLDILLKTDALQCEKFRSKIDEWKKAVALEREYQEKEHNNTVAIVHKRMAYNAIQREHSRVKNIITQTVVADVKKSLSTQFKDQQQGSAYLNSILHFMDERIS